MLTPWSLRIEEIRRVASEWEFDKRIHAPRAAKLLRELLGRIDELECSIKLPGTPDVGQLSTSPTQGGELSTEQVKRLADEGADGLPWVIA